MKPIKHLALPAYGFAKNLDAERRKVLAEWGEFLAFSKGETLVSEGGQLDALFFVIDGKLAPSREINGHATMPLAAIGRGGVFGEVDYFIPGGARATIRALTDGELWKITKERLDGWLESDFVICREVLKFLCAELAKHVWRADRRYADAKGELEKVTQNMSAENRAHPA